MIILIDTREDSFYIFPYFILLFQNSFERRKINIDENNIEELRYFFTNTNTLNIVKKFTEFCKKNNFGVFQLRTKFDTLNGSQGYKRLIKFIDSDKTIFLNRNIKRNMFDDLKPILEKIRDNIK